MHSLYTNKRYSVQKWVIFTTQPLECVALNMKTYLLTLYYKLYTDKYIIIYKTKKRILQHKNF